jgi:hypothetical protein
MRDGLREEYLDVHERMIGLQMELENHYLPQVKELMSSKTRADAYDPFCIILQECPDSDVRDLMIRQWWGV